jgi:hypothetical protein
MPTDHLRPITTILYRLIHIEQKQLASAVRQGNGKALTSTGDGIQSLLEGSTKGVDIGDIAFGKAWVQGFILEINHLNCARDSFFATPPKPYSPELMLMDIQTENIVTEHLVNFPKK